MEKNIYKGIFFISLSILMLELSLTRIFSVTLYYHFSFMIISLALFGLGASGTFIYIFRDKFTKEQVTKQLATFSIVFSITIPFVILILSNLRITPLITKSTFVILPIVYIICTIPFFIAGFCIPLSLKHFTHNVSKIYFADLFGASLGCLLVMFFLHFFDGPTTILGISFFGALAGFFFSRVYREENKENKESKRYVIVSVILLIIFCGLTFYNSKNKLIKINYFKGIYELSPLYEKWNSFSRIAIYPGNTATPDNQKRMITAGLSTQYSGPAVDQLYMDIDAGAGTMISKFDGDITKLEYLKYDITSLGYYLKENPEVLIIGVGGGIDVLTALAFGSVHITGVEYNPIIVKVIRNQLKEFTGNLFHRSDVNIIIDEGRSFVKRCKKKFDIIQLSLVDTSAAAAAGAYVLAESPLYTTEAFVDYLGCMRENGLLVLTRWIYDPPRETIRLASLGVAALKRSGISKPENHIIIIKHHNKSIATFILKKSAFSLREINKVEDICKRLRFEIVYSPLTSGHRAFSELIRSEDPRTFYKTYPFDISPSTDDKPFFFHVIRIRDFLKAITVKEGNVWDSDAILILVSVFCIALFLVSLFIFVPLCITKRETLTGIRFRALKELLYFSCLGFGFMLVEISFIQKFILFLGHPIFALSVVLFSLLLFCGIGSYLTSKFGENGLKAKLKKILFFIMLFIIAYIVLLPNIFYHFITLPKYMKIALSILCLAPISLLMGMPLPIGIKIVNRNYPELIPWAWGINSGTSVLGSIVTLILAMNFGFNITLLLGSIVYFIALLLQSSYKV